MFRAHKKDLTWDEDFDITDMVVVNDDITGKSAQQAHVLHKIVSIFMPMFIHNDKMALYFLVLA